MGKLSELLKYKTEVVLRDERRKEDIAKVWVRLLGDEDLKEAFKFSRIASAKKRASLLDNESSDKQDELSQLSEQPVSELIEVIVAAKENEFTNEAGVIVDREELPEISSIAKLPDAPTLAEQEKLDALIEKQEKEYAKKIEEYVATKVTELKASLAEKSVAELAEIAATELVNVLSLQAFLEELNDQKIFRGTFDDAACKERSFETIEDCKNANMSIRAQLLEAYNNLEISGDEIKN